MVVVQNPCHLLVAHFLQKTAKMLHIPGTADAPTKQVARHLTDRQLTSNDRVQHHVVLPLGEYDTVILKEQLTGIQTESVWCLRVRIFWIVDFLECR
ncbi:hypothetical protein D9M68_976830 [compost metagenome]